MGRRVLDSHGWDPVRDLPAGQTGSKANYTFKVTETPHDNKLMPERVEILKDAGIFVNTGREFFSGFDYLYDYTNGFVEPERQTQQHLWRIDTERRPDRTGQSP